MRLIPYERLTDFGLQYSRSHLLALMEAGKFPRHVRVSARRVGWLDSELEKFIAEKANERPQPA